MRRPVAAQRPAPSHLDQAATLLPQGAFRDSASAGSAGWNRRRRGDLTPPSWDPAARYRQPCTSCLKTGEKSESRVLAGCRGARRPRAPKGLRAALPPPPPAGPRALSPRAATRRTGPPRGGSVGPGLPLPAAWPPARSQPFRFQPHRGPLLPACTRVQGLPARFLPTPVQAASAGLLSSPPCPAPGKTSPWGRCKDKTEHLQGSGRWIYAKFSKLTATSQ